VKGVAMTDRQKDLLQKFAAIGGLLLLTLVFSVTSNAFFTLDNGMTVALQVTSIAYLGVAATCIIITGGIDLSAGSVVALSGVVAALAVKAGLPVPLGMLCGVLAGTLCGAANGLSVTWLKLPPFIATLGMMLIARGLALQITGARAVSGLGDDFGALGNGALWHVEKIDSDGFPNVIFPGIPYPVLLMIGIAILVAIMLRRTTLGRHIYAAGSNAEAARLSGVHVNRTVLFTYVLGGALAGLTGCVLMSRLVTGQPNEGVNYELDAIASAVIGGTSLSGGVGSISGTMIGAFVIGILRNGLNMNGVSSFMQQIIIGLVILLTVWIDQMRNRRGKTSGSGSRVAMTTKKQGGPPMKKLTHLGKLLPVVALGVASGMMFWAGTAHADQKEIAVIVKTVNSAYWQNVQKGADGAKGAGNYKISFLGPAAESDVADEVNMVDDAVNRHVAAIVLAASDPDALVPAVKKAWEARIPVVVIDSPVADAGSKYYQAFLATDNYKAGQLCAKELVDKVGTTGKIAIMSYVAGAGSEIGRVGGFRDYLKAHSQLEVIGPYYSQSQMASALNQTTDVLSAHPDLKGIFGANEPTAIGMGRALVQSGKAGKVVAVGFDGNPDLQGFVKDGTLVAIAVQGSYQMGEKGVETAISLIHHKKVPKLIDTGVVIVTKANIDSTAAKNVLY
jgi:ribose/xylose/arabinose/galactoside ABC-type transport system permease subunit/ABC-type sugar transport system substrate-binding protein